MTEDDTDCEITSNRVIRNMLPYYSIHLKNRLYDNIQMEKMGWTIGHFYIHLSKVGCHHCILIRNGSNLEIYDSFINHRTVTHRAMPADEFWRVLRIVLNKEYSSTERCVAYCTLFMPPENYLTDWPGSIERMYLDQCN